MIRLRTGAFSACAVAAALMLGFYTSPPAPGWAFGYAGLMLAALVSSFLDPQPALSPDDVAMRLPFVSEVAALLLFGPHLMTLVAVAGVGASALTDPPRTHPIRRLLVNVVTAVLATQAAGAAYQALGGVQQIFAWPWQAVPIAAAICACCLVTTAGVDLLMPLVTRRPLARSWPAAALRGVPTHVVGAAVAVALVEIVHRQAWELLPVIAVPLFFASRAYRASRRGSDDVGGGHELLESLDQGLAAVDRTGRVTRWNEPLARLTSCPPSKALGRQLADALPALAATTLPRALTDALVNRTPKTLPRVVLAGPGGDLTLHVRILPDVGGATILWQDVTEQTRAEGFARAAEAANDGLWEIDLRTELLTVSTRWKAMIGLPAGASIARRDDWFERIHADDLAPFKEALEEHLSGVADHFQREVRLRHEDGSYRCFLCRGLAPREPGRRPVRIAGSLTDIADRTGAQERVRNVGFRDPLTGLVNRSVFVEGIGQRLEELKQQGGGRFAVLYLDLDRFKVVNDSLGHLVGDELLTAVSRRLETCLRPSDALARLGGDEFAILLNGLGDEIQANAIAFRIQETLSAPFAIAGREVFASASIGIAFSRSEYVNPEQIMRDADTAMYNAKAHGKARHELFDADMHARELDRLGFESDLRQAVKTHAFEVHYQPIVSLASGMCAGFEALIRWKRNGKAISPVQFIPVAEELGLIEPLGTWVLQEACRTFAGWQRRFPESGLDCITVNVSARQLVQQGFVYLVEQAVGAAALKPCDLRLEITETALMHDPHAAAQVLRDLRNFGVKIYLDDFGTGFSSLSHLHKLPVDALKIDRSFVTSLILNDRPAIVESILALARTLHTSVVAEGVETSAQARELERLGCRQAQGFFFSPPLTATLVEELLTSRRALGTPAVPVLREVPPARHEGEPGSPIVLQWPAYVPVAYDEAAADEESTPAGRAAAR